MRAGIYGEHEEGTYETFAMIDKSLLQMGHILCNVERSWTL